MHYCLRILLPDRLTQNVSKYTRFSISTHRLITTLNQGFRDAGNRIENSLFFDTMKVFPRLRQEEVRVRAIRNEINLRYYPDGSIGVSLDETTTQKDLEDLLWVFQCARSPAQVADTIVSPTYPVGSVLADEFFHRYSTNV